MSLVDKDRYHQKRVAAYCRVSTDSEEQLTSYKTQKKVYTEMIQANKDWTMAGIYADEGISGTMTKNRAEFNKMIKDCYFVHNIPAKTGFLSMPGPIWGGAT